MSRLIIVMSKLDFIGVWVKPTAQFILPGRRASKSNSCRANGHPRLGSNLEIAKHFCSVIWYFNSAPFIFLLTKDIGTYSPELSFCIRIPLISVLLASSQIQDQFQCASTKGFQHVMYLWHKISFFLGNGVQLTIVYAELYTTIRVDSYHPHAVSNNSSREEFVMGVQKGVSDWRTIPVQFLRRHRVQNRTVGRKPRYDQIKRATTPAQATRMFKTIVGVAAIFQHGCVSASAAAPARIYYEGFGPRFSAVDGFQDGYIDYLLVPTAAVPAPKVGDLIGVSGCHKAKVGRWFKKVYSITAYEILPEGGELPLRARSALITRPLIEVVPKEPREKRPRAADRYPSEGIAEAIIDTPQNFCLSTSATAAASNTTSASNREDSQCHGEEETLREEEETTPQDQLAVISPVISRDGTPSVTFSETVFGDLYHLEQEIPFSFMDGQSLEEINNRAYTNGIGVIVDAIVSIYEHVTGNVYLAAFLGRTPIRKNIFLNGNLLKHLLSGERTEPRTSLKVGELLLLKGAQLGPKTEFGKGKEADIFMSLPETGWLWTFSENSASWPLKYVEETKALKQWVFNTKEQERRKMKNSS
ncbi:hypothetical protein Pelo_3153 [Pelomyxa schiedti]|nr:hypothetical protein Pelo_3153 [Pelomyxa schiedti]